MSTKHLSRLIAITSAGGLLLALATTAPDAGAQSCPSHLSPCGSTCYDPSLQQCYGGVVCGANQAFCPGPKACYAVGTQQCCTTTVVAASAACPVVVSPSTPTPGGGSGEKVTPPTSRGSVAYVGGVGTPCHNLQACNGAPFVNVTRTPIAPAGWTAGPALTFHPNKVDEEHDRDIDTSRPDGAMRCFYGVGPAMVWVSKARNAAPGGSYRFLSDVNDGFCM